MFGATVVAVGTSIPELATTIIAKLRGHDEIGLGTILGSNIFNGFFIVSVAAMICPIAVGWQEVSVALACGILSSPHSPQPFRPIAIIALFINDLGPYPTFAVFAVLAFLSDSLSTV